MPLKLTINSQAYTAIPEQDDRLHCDLMHRRTLSLVCNSPLLLFITIHNHLAHTITFTTKHRDHVNDIVY